MPAKELLLYVLAVSVSVLTVFLSVLLYQLTLTVRESRSLMTKADATVEMVQNIVATPLAIMAAVKGAASSLLGRFQGEEDTDELDGESSHRRIR